MTSNLPSPVYLEITPDQMDALKEHFDWISRNYKDGKPLVMLVGQFLGNGECKVGIIPHEKAVLLQEKK